MPLVLAVPMLSLLRMPHKVLAVELVLLWLVIRQMIVEILAWEVTLVPLVLAVPMLSLLRMPHKVLAVELVLLWLVMR